MRIRTGLAVIATSAPILAACEDMFSLTPMTEIGSFEVQVGLSETDATLEELTDRHGAKVHRDPKPRKRAIARDYLAAVDDGRCLLLIEGRGTTTEAIVKVTLQAAEGSQCSQRMHALYGELKTGLLRSSPRTLPPR